MAKATRYTQDMVDEYISKGYWTGETTAALWDRNAELFGRAEALVDSRKRLSWSEIKQKLEEGKIQVLPLVGRTPEREDVFDFSFKYLTLHGAIFVRKGDSRIKSADDLADKAIIVMEGDNAEEYVKRENVSKNIILVENYEQAMKLLASGKHDAVIAQRLMGIQLLKDLGINEIVPVNHKLDKFKQDFSFAVKEGDKELLALLNEGLSIVMADGTFESLYEKWFAPILGRPLSLKVVLKYVLMIALPISLFILLFLTLLFRSEVKRKTKGLLQEIEERKKFEKDLGSSEQKFKSLYSSMTEGVALHDVIYDEHGKAIDYTIQEINPAGRRYHHGLQEAGQGDRFKGRRLRGLRRDRLGRTEIQNQKWDIKPTL